MELELSFTPNPEVLALPPEQGYKHDYAAIFEEFRNFRPHMLGMHQKDIDKALEELGLESEQQLHVILTCRQLIMNDLFFLLYFIFLEGAPPELLDEVNGPFIVQAAREVEDGPQDKVIYTWSRDHFKSTLITQARKLQKALQNPGRSYLTMAYAAKLAKKHLRGIRDVCQNNPLLRACFPDRIWRNPDTDAPLWSVDSGLVLRGHGNRSDPTFYAGGLLEGMPTGYHFDDIDFDDIMTEDMKRNPQVITDAIAKFDNALHLGSGSTYQHRVIGTFYQHNDVMVHVRDKVYEEGPLKGQKVYQHSHKPATDDGTSMGRPVFRSQAWLDMKKLTADFNEQILCDPSPRGSVKLHKEDVDIVPYREIPHGLYRILLVDPAGDKAVQKTGTDPWGLMVFGVLPGVDEFGLNDVYIIDAKAERMEHDESIQEICDMYLANPPIRKLGIEKTALATTEKHVTRYLREQVKPARIITLENGRLILLKDRRREKKRFIEGAVMLPLGNRKIHISDRVPQEYREHLFLEMDQHDRGHDEFLNLLAYLYADVIPSIPELSRKTEPANDTGMQPVGAHRGHYGFTAA